MEYGDGAEGILAPSSNSLPNRQSRRIPEYDYQRPGCYFLTICTRDHHHAFSEITNNEMHLSHEGRISQQVWLSLPERFTNVAIDAAIFMPNHMHGIVIIKKPPVTVQDSNIPECFKPHMQKLEDQRLVTRPEAYKLPSVGEIVRTFKAASTRLIRKNGSPSFAWQANYWLTILPTKEHVNRTRHYIYHNPATWQKDKLYTVQ